MPYDKEKGTKKEAPSPGRIQMRGPFSCGYSTERPQHHHDSDGDERGGAPGEVTQGGITSST